jgi:hypothetical protein
MISLIESVQSPVKMQGRENNADKGNVRSYIGGLINCTLVSPRNLSGQTIKKQYFLSSNKSMEIIGQRSLNNCLEEVITTLRIIFIVVLEKL